MDYDAQTLPPADTALEISVARAKRTDRAEARRRYRSEMDDPDGQESTTPGSSETPSSSARSATTSAGQPERMGIGRAFRAAIHPLDVRGDLRNFSTHVRQKALWIPALLVVASGIAIYALGTADVFAQILFTYFIQTPAIGGVFLAGFLARGGSWLIGLMVGIVSALAFSLLIVSGRLGDGLSVTAAEIQGAILYAFLFSPIMGALFAASAAWYRRFLQLSSPNRARRAEEQRRAAAKKERSQKAGARR